MEAPDSSSDALEEADLLELQYDHFRGDIGFTVGDADLSACWGWVPILDFAISLGTIAGDLGERGSSHATFEFTESRDRIFFDRNADDIRVSSTYAALVGSVSLHEFQAVCRTFLKTVVSDLSAAFPSLQANTDLADALDGLDLGGVN